MPEPARNMQSKRYALTKGNHHDASDFWRKCNTADNGFSPNEKQLVGEKEKNIDDPIPFPDSMDSDTLQVVQEYLLQKVLGHQLPQNDNNVCQKDHCDDGDVCDEDDIVAFMGRVHRQAEQQRDLLRQTNFLLHGNLMDTDSFVAGKRKVSQTDNRSQAESDFEELEERRALARDLLRKMIGSIEKKKKAIDSNHQGGKGFDEEVCKSVLDKRTLCWLRKVSGAQTGSDSSSINHKHPAMKGIVENGGPRRLTRAMMARQQQEQQKEQRQRQNTTLKHPDKGDRCPEETEALQALLWATEELKKTTSPQEASSHTQTRNKRQKRTDSLVKQVRGRVGTSDSCEKTNRTSNSTVSFLSPQDESSVLMKQSWGMQTVGLAHRQSVLDEAIAPSSFLGIKEQPLRSTSQGLGRLQFPLEPSTASQTMVFSKSRSRRKLQQRESSMGVLGRKYPSVLTNECS